MATWNRLDLGRAEAIVRRDETLPRENFRYGDRIRAYVYDVRREQRGPQIFLSRTHPEFMAKLFAQEVPEVYARHRHHQVGGPRSRQPRRVVSRDVSIDPVGACVGMRGSRAEGGGERTPGREDRHHPVVARRRHLHRLNGLAPAEVVKVVLDEDAERIGSGGCPISNCRSPSGARARMCGSLPS